ncbi:Uncharacterised protein [Mycobacteroides abscessus subsp. abscessus]|nr:Uncharacterised protein [Mycobacteroides abscessus subsp. abscessus]
MVYSFSYTGPSGGRLSCASTLCPTAAPSPLRMMPSPLKQCPAVMPTRSAGST